MSRDPKPMSKPYLAGNMPYLTQYRVQTWEDGEPTGKDETEYSEFQKPYAYDEDEPEDYSWWENTWPGFKWPDIPPVTWPDPVDSPCTIDDSCTFIKINGPAVMECGDSVPYTALWVTLGCAMPPWWAIFTTWSLSGGDGECTLSPGLVITRINCSSVAAPQVLTLTVEGPFGCTDSIEVVVSCEECCEEFEITGAETVNAGWLWTGTISPACPGAACEVTSNSGCSLTCDVNAAGSQVTVQPGGLDCGSFTVTVTDTGVGEECGASADSKTVRINGGNARWRWFTYSGPGNCSGNCNTGCGAGTCSNFIHEGLRYGNGDECSLTYTFSCKGCEIAGCEAQWTSPAPPGATCLDCEERGWQADCSSPPGAGRNCFCTSWGWRTCEWKCSC